MLRVIEYFAKSLKVAQGHGNGTIRKISHDFLLAFRSNYGHILYLYHFRDKARYRSKIVIIFTPLHSTPLYKGRRRNIAITFGRES